MLFNRVVSQIIFGFCSLALSFSLIAADKTSKKTPKASSQKTVTPEPAKVDTIADESNIKKVVESRFPGVEVSHIGKTPFPGLFEVMVGDSLAYTDAKVSYIMIGSLIEPNTRTNLTQERMRKLKAIPWAELPLDAAIKTVKGNGSRKFALFHDVDCPFCRRIDKEIAKLNDVTIYTFLYPIPELHPDAARKSKVIWCAADRNKAWEEFTTTSKLPEGEGNCENPIDKVIAIGKKYRVSATPTLVFTDGRTIPGALSLAQLETELNKSEGGATAGQAAAKPAVAKPATAEKPATQESKPLAKEATNDPPATK